MRSTRKLCAQAAKAALYGFAALGVLDSAGRFILIPIIGTIYGQTIRLPHDMEVDKVVDSPDGSMRAIIYIWSGSGLSAGCGQMISVVDRHTSANIGWQRTNLVYEADCSPVAQISWESASDPRARPRLRINANAGKADFMSRFAMDGTVSVAFGDDP